MTPESSILERPDDDEGQLDPDLSLVTAYLARELSTTQIIALEERLVADAPFREKVQPAIDAWLLPLLIESAVRADPPLLETRTVVIGSALRPRRSAVFRMAASIAIIIIPLIAVAQLAQYVSSHERAPGHSIARMLVSFLTHRDDEFHIESELLDERGMVSDGPVQFALVPSPEEKTQQLPVLELSPPSGQSRNLGAILGVKELSDGRVMINDAWRLQVLIFDSTLGTAQVALDSTMGSASSYGLFSGSVRTPLISWLGDSTIIRAPLPDQYMRVLDGSGRVARAMDLPTSPGLGNTTGQLTSGPSYVDERGRILFRSAPQGSIIQVPRDEALYALLCGGREQISACGGGGATGSRTGGAGSAPTASAPFVDRADTLPLLRVDLGTRTFDTVTYLTQPLNLAGLSNGGGRVVLRHDTNGKVIGATQLINPLYYVDDWAVLSDGTIAVVRGRDYHVEWIDVNGNRSSSAKLPFEWKRLTDQDKQRLVDSVHHAVDSVDMEIVVTTTTQRDPLQDSIVRANGGGLRGLRVLDSIRNANGGRVVPGSRADRIVKGIDPRPPSRSSRAGPSISSATRAPALTERTGPMRAIPYDVVPLAAIADYYPPIRIGSVMPDRDGNLWILPTRTTQSRSGELVYDIVNPKRGLVQRVRLPLGRSVVGFGKGGVVYLQRGSMQSGFVVEKRTILK